LADADSLWPEAEYAARRTRTWCQAIALAVAAATLLLVALGLEWRSITRAEATLAAERDALRASLAEVMARRDSSASLAQRVRAVEDFEIGTPNWLDLLASVDVTLPPDASLHALRASADTVLLVGQARRAAPILRAFSESSAFDGARTDAPIDQLVENGEVVAERFTILARPRGRAP
jgi:Tfp pilus assembly protein PilN